MFIACGQDAAHAIDGSTCMTTIDATESGVYVAVTLPSLPVGTVGGGTGIDTQNECLKILGVAGGGSPAGSNAKKLAEIIGAGVLAGESRLSVPSPPSTSPAPTRNWAGARSGREKSGHDPEKFMHRTISVKINETSVPRLRALPGHGRARTVF